MARARVRPTRGSSQVPPQSGTRPSLLKAITKLAERAAITMSQPRASVAPAPAATPLTAQITGFGSFAGRRTSGVVKSQRTCGSGAGPFGSTLRSLRSCRRETRPAPVISEQRMASSRSACFRHSESCWCMTSLKAVQALRAVQRNGHYALLNMARIDSQLASFKVWGAFL